MRGQYLTPQISYTLNLVFRYISEWEGNAYNRLRYKLNGEDETRVFIIYPSYMREDGWFIAPLYQFTSQDKTVDFQFVFEDRAITLLVAGIEFHPLEEKVSGVLFYFHCSLLLMVPIFLKALEKLWLTFFKYVIHRLKCVIQYLKSIKT